MIIPWNTDAPIYHFPFATLGLIGVNVAVFAVMLATGGEGFDEWVLIYGDGLHPLQWITSAFMHGGFGHLIGNMIFLWAFGLVVEGKLGWWRFLIAYFGLAIAQNATEQSMTFWFHEGGAIGASGVIFGLLAMCLVWAPENEMSCIWWIGWRAVFFEITIFWLVFWYIGWEIFIVWWTEFAIGSSLLHTIGALFGFALGVVMVKGDYVDCEGWDLLTLMANRYGKSESPRRSRESVERRFRTVVTSEEEEASVERVLPAELIRQSQLKFRKLLAEGDYGGALTLYEKAGQNAAGWQLPEKDLLKLVEGLCDAKLPNEAVPLLEEYLRRFEKRAVQVRLKLAQLLIEHQQRPSYASRILDGLPATVVPEAYARLRKALERKAQKMIDDGVLELEGERGEARPCLASHFPSSHSSRRIPAGNAQASPAAPCVCLWRAMRLVKPWRLWP